MARTKKEETAKERFAILKAGKEKREVKAWQYYSIFDFCRSFGRSREDADQIARRCRDKALDGAVLAVSEGAMIRIEEREVPV